MVIYNEIVYNANRDCVCSCCQGIIKAGENYYGENDWASDVKHCGACHDKNK